MVSIVTRIPNAPLLTAELTMKYLERYPHQDGFATRHSLTSGTEGSFRIVAGVGTDAGGGEVSLVADSLVAGASTFIKSDIVVYIYMCVCIPYVCRCASCACVGKKSIIVASFLSFLAVSLIADRVAPSQEGKITRSERRQLPYTQYAI
jgi:hypothetical protein